LLQKTAISEIEQISQGLNKTLGNALECYGKISSLGSKTAYQTTAGLFFF